MIELRVVFDPAKNQIQVHGPIDQLPVACLNMLADAERLIRARSVQAELTGTSKIVAAQAVPDMDRFNGNRR